MKTTTYDDATIKTIIRETVKHASWDSGLLSDKVKRALIDARVLDTVSVGRIALEPAEIAALRLRAWELAGCAY